MGFYESVRESEKRKMSDTSTTGSFKSEPHNALKFPTQIIIAVKQIFLFQTKFHKNDILYDIFHILLF